jgi:type II secretory pathway pseudopilin PulG
MNNMKKNNGISLIVLVITIIVIIILAGSVILSLSQNNPIASATEARFKTTIDSYNSELTLALSNKYAVDSTFNPNILYAQSWDGGATVIDTVKQYITSMTVEDGPKYAISQGRLQYIGSNTNEKQLAKTLGINDSLILWLDGNDFKNVPPTATWMDKSGNASNGTCYNFAYTAISGSDGSGGVVFDGSNDYTLVTGNFPATLTIEAWGNAKVIDGKIIWSFDSPILASGPNLFATSNKLALNTGDGGANAFSNQTAYPSINVWHHYIVTFNQSTNQCKLYLDGVFVGTAVYKDPSSTKLFIGRFSEGSYDWNGSIKGIRVYNRILSDAEILKNYNDTK